jgi:hypothetical protein
MSVTDLALWNTSSTPDMVSREDLLIRSITTLMSIVKPQTTESSEPKVEKDRHHEFQLLLDRIALLFVREPAGEVYSVVLSHASSGHCPYDLRDPSELSSSENKETRTILYLCPDAAPIKDESRNSRYSLQPLLGSFGMANEHARY